MRVYEENGNAELTNLLNSFHFDGADIENIISLIAERDKLLSESARNQFNIFSFISDTYRKENFHSDILATILNPNQPVIGNVKYLQTFLECLKTLKPNLEIAAYSDNTIVTKEEYTGSIEKR
jgi:hypothetical protein